MFTTRMKKYIIIASIALIVFVGCKKEDITPVPDICRVLKAKEISIDGKYYFIYTNGQKVQIPIGSDFENIKIGETVCFIGNKN